MARRRIRTEPPTGSAAPAIVAGLGLGLAVGFLLGEMFAGESPKTLKRALTPWRRPIGARTSLQMTAVLQTQLEQALGPDGQSLDLVMVGKNALEIHGWVTSRAARGRALRLARETLGPDIRLVDGLLVWGEDDAVVSQSAAEEREPA